ncbi:hypothetical protein GCM10022278_14570 [Allohahella marinimesophila]|uniref:diguanylate cyclase n=1 Tax=Allohahella marinimesophila TaxID=1054972 RepID=A0ABP7NZ99_9GAMM
MASEVLLEPSVQRLQLGHHTYFWKADTDTATIEDVLKLAPEQWTFNGQSGLSFGYVETPYWIRTSIRNPDDVSRDMLLELSYPVLDHVELYQISDGELVADYRTGDKLHFVERPLHHRNFLFPVRLGPHSQHDIYLRVQSTSALQVPLTLWSQTAFDVADQSRLLFEGMYYGIALVMFLYNLFVYLAVSERRFLYYIGYIACMPLFLASLHGLAFQYLWPGGTWWNDQSIIFFLNGTLAFGCLFTLNFLSITQQRHPIAYRAAVVMIVLSTLLVCLSVIVPYRVLVAPTIVLAFICCVILFGTGVIRWWAGDPSARLYTAAWAFMLFSGIILALSKFTVLPQNLFTENATQVGSAFAIILFSIALADRLNKDKHALFRAQKQAFDIQVEANNLLETRVQERTSQLAELNQRLLEISATDTLTLLKNRGYFDRAFRTSFVEAFRYGRPLSLLIIDIDHFKHFNDDHGHLVGDDCIKMMAACLREIVTRPQDLAARYGGEEFVVLLPDTPLDGAVKVAEKIREQISQSDFRVSSKTLHVTVSVGVHTMTPTSPSESSKFFANADQALYEAKDQGRNRVVTWQEIG